MANDRAADADANDEDELWEEGEEDEVDLDAARATLARVAVGTIYLTRAAARRLDAVGWDETDLIPRVLAGEVGDVDVAIQQEANERTLRSFSHDPIDDDAPSPAVAGMWRLPTDGDDRTAVVVVVEIEPFGCWTDSAGIARGATVYIHLAQLNTES